jgi:hypothetical protein
VIVVGTTLAAFVMDQEDTWGSWIENIEEVAEHTDEEIRVFAAIEVDALGLEPFEMLLDCMAEISNTTPVRCEFWTYSLDDGRTEVTTGNRLRHITTGQNLVTDYAVSEGADWLLFMAADCRPPDDVIPRMLELDHPLVAPNVPTYCLDGPKVGGLGSSTAYDDAGWDVRKHMASAAALMIHSDVFRRVRWRWDPEDGSDDPCFHRDALEHLGIETLVRHDVTAKHYPLQVGAIETRGHDMTVYREAGPT